MSHASRLCQYPHPTPPLPYAHHFLTAYFIHALSSVGCVLMRFCVDDRNTNITVDKYSFFTQREIKTERKMLCTAHQNCSIHQTFVDQLSQIFWKEISSQCNYDDDGNCNITVATCYIHTQRKQRKGKIVMCCASVFAQFIKHLRISCRRHYGRKSHHNVNMMLMEAVTYLCTRAVYSQREREEHIYICTAHQYLLNSSTL